MKLKDEMVEAAANCSLALAIDPSSVKALFRRGQVMEMKSHVGSKLNESSVYRLIC